ncbi:phosphatidate cytidylyltransferase [Lachnospiraceae bacterium C7]|nr:phosphatidate cytidylyltransferase [Lachnospiraceae bacterium C7]
MFKTRLLSGIVLVALSIALIVCGGDVLLLSTLAISLIGMFELYRVFKIEKSVVAIIGYLAAIALYGNIRFNFLKESIALVMIFMILLMFAYVFTYPKYNANQISVAFFGMFYVAAMLSYVYRIRTLKNGLYLAFLVFLCSWGCDTCAYCFGKLFGKHKMSPKLSPKKSIEGAIGGILGSALLTALYLWIFSKKMNMMPVEILVLSIIAAVAAFISMIGDLTASAIKRNYEIKDYGKLIPGHGGIMDRFDSMIITAPIIYYLAAYTLQ